MNKELIDRAWACLPRDFKEKVKKEYARCVKIDADDNPNLPAYAVESAISRRALLEKLFGEHNLTSDAEEEEMLTVEKGKVLYRFRMAEACKIGNNPETDYWIGYSKAIQDLFGLEGEPYVTPNDADTVIQGWVAIDEAFNQCFLHTEKPIQKAQPIADTGDYDTVWDSEGKTYLLDNSLFPDMDSDSEPQEVEITIKRKKK